MNDTPSANRRWSPPALSTPTRQPASKAPFVLDEQRVRTMLAINPALRAGRTTAEVKRDMERGGQGSSAGQPVELHPSPNVGAGQLVALFVAGRRSELDTQLAEIDERRQSLEVEAVGVRAQAVEAIRAFVRVIGDSCSADALRQALAAHEGWLARLGTSSNDLLGKDRSAGSKVR